MLKRFFPSELSEFKKNVAVIFSGSAVSQLVAIAATPWLARLYTPAQYGIFGLFLSMATIAGTLSSFRYTTAIQITQDAADAQRLMQFCRLSVWAVSVLLFLLLLIGYPVFILLLRAEDLGHYIFLLPVATLCTGLIETYSIWLNRNKSFKSLSYNRVLISLITVLVTIVWAYLIGASFRGLLAGLVAAQAIGTVFLHLQSRKFGQPSARFDWVSVKPLLRAHRKFPIYSLPSDLINVFTNQLPVFMINSFAGATEVGYFNMSNRILGLPSVFISTSIGEVFRQRATEDYHKHGSCRPIFLKTFKLLALVGIVPFLTIALFGPWLFSFALGSRWQTAGEYSRILAVMFFLRFCISPLTYTFYIAHKQGMDFVGHIIMLISTTVTFYLGFVFFAAKTTPLLIFSVAYSLVYLYYLYFSYKFSKEP